MSKDGGRPISRIGSIARSVRARRGLLTGEGAAGVRTAIRTPTAAAGLLIALLFALLAAGVMIWTREQPRVAVGRVMGETRLVRVELSNRDREAEERAQEAARNRTPRVFVADADVLSGLEMSLMTLPQALAAAETLEAVDEGIRTRFRLTADLLSQVRGEFADAEAESAWKRRVPRLMEMLWRRPMLDEQSYQRAVSEGLSSQVRLVIRDRGEATASRADVLSLADATRREEAFDTMARDAGFAMPLRRLVVNRLMEESRPTFREDAARTAEAQNAAAAGVSPIFIKNPVGQVIFRRGDVLTQPQLDLYRAEQAQFRRTASGWVVGLRWGGLLVGSLAVTLALAGYTALFVQRVWRNVGRSAGVAGALLSALAASCLATVWAPGASALTTTAPIVLVAMLLTIVYDQRVALAYTVLLSILVCAGLDAGIGAYATIITGVCLSVWTLREVRDRGTLVRAALVCGVGLAAATAIVGFIERPIAEQTLVEIAVDAGLAFGGAIVCGAVALFVLPTVESLFDVATGMTLIELRDPKEPLLRELQVRAPGTYNHSLNVASIAEAAADAVGANALLTYVGALYHDIGKMNKPEYFVENRSGGPNKHDKLSPALSLLVIVGHVKDGLELAREFGLPKALHHFIEAHHGTTLVEYFFHRARQRALAKAAEEGHEGPPEPAPRADDAETRVAELDETEVPDEFEYRYPGPKPRTKEVAIVMLSDAVESATRALPDPTPARIEALVRSIANKRLLDGQFDDCELTLRELRAIAQSISRTVASIYHGRIAYPGVVGSGGSGVGLGGVGLGGVGA